MNAEIIKGLKEQALEVEETLKAIRTLINRYDSSYTSSISTDPPINNGYTLPTAKVEDKILHFMKNYLKKPAKMPDIETQFNSLRSKSGLIVNTARGMKKEGILTSIKYNKSNRQVYWGLPEWLDGNDYKPEFRPIEVPLGSKSEIL